MCPITTIGSVTLLSSASCGFLFCTKLPDQSHHGLRQLRTARLPKRDTIQLNTQNLFAFRRPGIIKTHALDELAIAGAARIRYYHVEKRALLGTASRQSNNDHVCAYG